MLLLLLLMKMMWCCTHAVPGKVMNVRVTAIGSDTLTISWDHRSDVTLYEVRHWELRDVTGEVVNVTSSSNFTLLRLAENTQYSFQVFFLFHSLLRLDSLLYCRTTLDTVQSYQ